MSHASGATVSGLYAIVDDAVHRCDDALVAAVGAALDGGAVWVQLRLKRSSERRAYELTRKCCRRFPDPERFLWVNDRVVLGALFPVCGVHLGQDDLPPALARTLLPTDRLIGWSTHNRDQLLSATENPAVDVVAIGPVRATSSKADAEATVGWSGVVEARRLCPKPIVAIGGLQIADYPRARESGADLVAMIGALGNASEICERARAIAALELEIVGEIQRDTM